MKQFFHQNNLHEYTKYGIQNLLATSRLTTLVQFYKRESHVTSTVLIIENKEKKKNKRTIKGEKTQDFIVFINKIAVPSKCGQTPPTLPLPPPPNEFVLLKTAVKKPTTNCCDGIKQTYVFFYVNQPTPSQPNQMIYC